MQTVFEFLDLLSEFFLISSVKLVAGKQILQAAWEKSYCAFN